MAFFANFRMEQDSFWDLVKLLEEKGGDKYWRQNTSGGTPGRPIYQQVAVALALYILGSPGITPERARTKLNIGKGTIKLYLWRTVNLLASR
jgi:hypothetical protein